MIAGRFDEYGRPLIKAILSLPGSDTQTEVTFLVDTGAFASCLSPSDSRDLGLDYGALPGIRSETVGIGGTTETISIPVNAMFSEDNGTRRFYRFLIDVLPEASERREMPSLLGQDILAHWRLTHSPSEGLLQAEVISAQFTYIQ